MPSGSARLLVRFRNGEERTYECEALFSRPEFHLLKDPVFFRAVRVDPGGYGVSWNDDVDLSEYELWTNGVPVASQERHSPAGLPGVLADSGASHR